MRAHMQACGKASQFICPQLPASPAAAMQLARTIIDELDVADLTLVGSSLGGYYATALAEQYGCRAVLLNPAVYPARELEKHIGLTTAWHSAEPFEFKTEYVAELQALTVPAITRAERYFLLAATGDEVLDWREMTAYYAGAHRHVIEGSDHGISDFETYLDEVMAFCESRAAFSGMRNRFNQ